MKKLLLFTLTLLMLLVPTQARAQAPVECTLEPVLVCFMDGCFFVWVCRYPGACPGEPWCPGRWAVPKNLIPATPVYLTEVTPIQKQGLDILVARWYIKNRYA